MKQNELSPNPIRTDRSNHFAWNTMKHRFPGNIREVISSNPELTHIERDQLEHLAEQAESGALIPPPPLPSWDYELWMDAYLRHPGERWDAAEWFYSETYGYRLVLDACRYWEHHRDPYKYIKLSEYDADTVFSVIRAYMDTDTAEPEQSLLYALHAALLGNKSDLSFSSRSRGLENIGTLDHDMMVINDGPACADKLAKAEGPVHIILDNTGGELAGDLVLARELIRTAGVQVVLHLKLMPIFVSDATVEDLLTFLKISLKSTDERVSSFAEDIHRYLSSKALVLAPDVYWCSPLFLENMPERIRKTLHQGSMAIWKGDLNYRRAVRDTIWPPGTSMQTAMGSVDLPRMIMLRVMKSDVSAGISADTVKTLDRTDPLWRVNGSRCFIQLVEQS